MEGGGGKDFNGMPPQAIQGPKKRESGRHQTPPRKWQKTTGKRGEKKKNLGSGARGAKKDTNLLKKASKPQKGKGEKHPQAVEKKRLSSKAHNKKKTRKCASSNPRQGEARERETTRSLRRPSNIYALRTAARVRCPDTRGPTREVTSRETPRNLGRPSQKAGESYKRRRGGKKTRKGKVFQAAKKKHLRIDVRRKRPRLFILGGSSLTSQGKPGRANRKAAEKLRVPT